MSEPTSDVTNTACELMSEAELHAYCDPKYAERDCDECPRGPASVCDGGMLADLHGDDLYYALRAERTARLKAEEERDLLRDVAMAVVDLDGMMSLGQFHAINARLDAALDRAKKCGALPER